MNGLLARQLLALSFWLWVGAMLVLYIGSFGLIIRVLLTALFP